MIKISFVTPFVIRLFINSYLYLSCLFFNISEFQNEKKPLNTITNSPSKTSSDLDDKTLKVGQQAAKRTLSLRRSPEVRKNLRKPGMQTAEEKKPESKEDCKVQ